jgi:hypothetical protein
MIASFPLDGFRVFGLRLTASRRRLRGIRVKCGLPSDAVAFGLPSDAVAFGLPSDAVAFGLPLND